MGANRARRCGKLVGAVELLQMKGNDWWYNALYTVQAVATSMSAIVFVAGAVTARDAPVADGEGSTLSITVPSHPVGDNWGSCGTSLKRTDPQICVAPQIYLGSNPPVVRTSRRAWTTRSTQSSASTRPSTLAGVPTAPSRSGWVALEPLLAQVSRRADAEASARQVGCGWSQGRSFVRLACCVLGAAVGLGKSVHVREGVGPTWKRLGLHSEISRARCLGTAAVSHPCAQSVTGLEASSAFQHVRCSGLRLGPMRHTVVGRSAGRWRRCCCCSSSRTLAASGRRPPGAAAG
jgi:hypothetical protein